MYSTFYIGFILVIAGLSITLWLKTRNYLIAKEHIMRQLEERNEELETMNVHITEQRDLLHQYHININASLTYASHMQNAVLPGDDTLLNSSFHHFVFSRPYDVVSGDFYFVRNVKNKLFIALGDCTGHGIPGACLSMMGHAFLSEIVLRPDIQSASQVVNILRERVKNMFGQNNQDANHFDGMDLAFCIFDKFTGKMQFSGANMNLFLVNDSTLKPWKCEVFKIKGDKMPVGFHPNDHIDFNNIEIPLKPGDTFYLYSDGYISQFGGLHGRKFKTSRFVKVLQHLQGRPMTEQKDILERIFMNWKGNQDQVDDVLVMGFKMKTHDELLQNLHQVLVSWNSNLYSVGSTIIDFQHQQLVLQINQLYDAYIKKSGSFQLATIFDQLEQYIGYHFQTEEKFLNKRPNDTIKSHISEHRFFTERIRILSNKYFSGDANISYELILFLKDWLINHIQHRDFNCRHLFNEDN